MCEDPYSPSEMMAIVAARAIQNGDIVFCGTGLPIVAAMAAKYINAPDSVIFFETGAINPQLTDIPMFVADSRAMYRSWVNTSLLDALGSLHNRKVGPRTVAILGGAQIDPYGNLNSTCIGEYLRPNDRFPGSGGAADAAVLCGRMIIFMPHERRRFVERVDYITSPGWLNGPTGRSQEGIRYGGPDLVVTDAGTLRFNPDTKEMYLESYYAWETPNSIAGKTGFFLNTTLSRPARKPSTDELWVLRKKVDPDGLIIRNKKVRRENAHMD